jgi:hypothetical protein
MKHTIPIRLIQRHMVDSEYKGAFASDKRSLSNINRPFGVGGLFYASAPSDDPQSNGGNSQNRSEPNKPKSKKGDRIGGRLLPEGFAAFTVVVFVAVCGVTLVGLLCVTVFLSGPNDKSDS